jgi:hypothetical protein
MSKKYSISKIINANSETLFKITSDFKNYSNWNTVIPVAEGELTKGTELQLMMKMNGKTRPFNPTVAMVEVNKSFLLSKVFLSKKMGELTHQFEFKELANNQTEFIQTWEGKGFLVKMMWSKIESGFSEFETFNDDLIRYINQK